MDSHVLSWDLDCLPSSTSEFITWHVDKTWAICTKRSCTFIAPCIAGIITINNTREIILIYILLYSLSTIRHHSNTASSVLRVSLLSRCPPECSITLKTKTKERKKYSVWMWVWPRIESPSPHSGCKLAAGGKFQSVQEPCRLETPTVALQPHSSHLLEPVCQDKSGKVEIKMKWERKRGAQREAGN